MIVQQEEDTSSQLMDHDDLHVLDMFPSLKTLTLVSIIQNKISTEVLVQYFQNISNSNICRVYPELCSQKFPT